MSKPAIRVTDSRFRYTNSVSTDISKRFAAERERIAAAKAAAGADTQRVIAIFDRRGVKL